VRAVALCSHCVSLPVSPTVSPSLCLPPRVSHCISLTVSPSPCLPLYLPHCVSLPVSPTVSPSLCLPPRVSHCISLTVSPSPCLPLYLPHCVSLPVSPTALHVRRERVAVVPRSRTVSCRPVPPLGITTRASFPSLHLPFTLCANGRSGACAAASATRTAARRCRGWCPSSSPRRCRRGQCSRPTSVCTITWATRRGVGVSTPRR
jgi:hypothetical protein